MPKELELALAKSFGKRKKKGKLKGVDRGAYIYGAMRKTGWRPQKEER